MTKEEIVYAAIRQIANTDKPERFAEINQTTFKVAMKVAELMQPSLPEGLDEAADKAALAIREDLPPELGLSHIDLLKAFRAGAEWMAGQTPHWTKDPDFLYGMVSTTCRKDGVTVLAHNGKTIPLSELEKLPVTDIQIRKKED